MILLNIFLNLKSKHIIKGACKKIPSEKPNIKKQKLNQNKISLVKRVFSRLQTHYWNVHTFRKPYSADATLHLPIHNFDKPLVKERVFTAENFISFPIPCKFYSYDLTFVFCSGSYSMSSISILSSISISISDLMV